MTWMELLPWLLAISIILVGWFGIIRIQNHLRQFLLRTLDQAQAEMLSKLVYYGLGLLVTMLALAQVGLKLSMLLGTAGVLTIAMSFAAQNTVSSAISGFFLWLERPFRLDDTILVNRTGVKY